MQNTNVCTGFFNFLVYVITINKYFYLVLGQFRGGDGGRNLPGFSCVSCVLCPRLHTRVSVCACCVRFGCISGSVDNCPGKAVYLRFPGILGEIRIFPRFWGKVPKMPLKCPFSSPEVTDYGRILNIFTFSGVLLLLPQKNF